MTAKTAQLLRSWWSWLIRAHTRPDANSLRQATRVAAFSLAMFVWVFVFATIYWLLDAPVSACVVLAGGSILVVILLALRAGTSPATCGNILCAAALCTYTTLALFNGGAGAPSTMWYASVPVLSMLLLDRRAGFYWTGLSMLAITGFALAHEFGVAFPNEVNAAGLRFLHFSGLLGLIGCICMLVCVLKSVELSAQLALHDANRCLALQAATDGLTGILNRRGFDKLLHDEWKRHERTQMPLSVALIDFDLFKQYNDACGHLAGDDCLRTIAKVLEASVRRPGDAAARFGGEEFAVILSNTCSQGAVAVVSDIRERVRALGLPHPRSSVSDSVTISVGLTTIIPSEDESALDVLRQADVALYRAKANGRDQIVHIADVEPAIAEALGGLSAG